MVRGDTVIVATGPGAGLGRGFRPRFFFGWLTTTGAGSISNWSIEISFGERPQYPGGLTNPLCYVDRMETPEVKTTYNKNHQAYYIRHRDEISQKRKEQYQLNAEAERLRSRDRYWRNKALAETTHVLVAHPPVIL